MARVLPFTTRRWNCACAFAMRDGQALSHARGESILHRPGSQTPRQTVSRPSAAFDDNSRTAMDTAAPSDANSHSNSPPAPVTLGEAFRYWLKLGFISFGGPTGQIAIMHQDLVERKRWISEKRFLHALNYCMVLPGPEAQQLATYIG